MYLQFEKKKILLKCGPRKPKSWKFLFFISPRSHFFFHYFFFLQEFFTKCLSNRRNTKKYRNAKIMRVNKVFFNVLCLLVWYSFCNFMFNFIWHFKLECNDFLKMLFQSILCKCVLYFLLDEGFSMYIKCLYTVNSGPKYV